MVRLHGRLQAAQALLAAPGLSDGFTALWQCGRRDLTVEAVILNAQWSSLFTESELGGAAAVGKVIQHVGYAAAPCDTERFDAWST
jgi:hypothetical protein